MKNKILNHVVVFLVFAVAALTVFNAFQIFAITSSSSSGGSTFKGSINVKSSGNAVNDVIAALIPSGTPDYGAALSVSYDDPVTSLNILAGLDRKIPMSSLSEEEKKRYINIGTQISCEFCCGAPSVIDNSGRDLCGCAHAASFRGLSKYMLQSYPELSDDEILMELTRWKSLFYPKNMVEKGVAAVDNGLELTPQVLNDRELLKKIKSNDVSSIGELPSMVGGC